MDENRPNIILITPHDLGTHLGCYGWDPKLSTPNLDRLAEEGVRFENHFCTAPFCSPSRGAIFTGRYPHSNGLMGLVNLDWDLPETEKTLPQYLNEAGYKTCLFGFQHISKEPSRSQYDHISPRNESSCEQVVPMVTDFLKNRKEDGSRPFFAEVGFAEVHRAYGSFEEITLSEDEVTPLPFLDDTEGLRKDQVMFYEVIRKMDSAVGQILETIDEAGLKNNTIVVFTTDHGIAFPRAKATLYDPGIHTTLIMRWSDGFKGGSTFQELLSNVDILPTLLEAVGIAIPSVVQGKSFLGLVQDGDYEPNEMVFAEKNTHSGDAKRCVRTEQYKYIRNFDEGPCLALPTDIEVTATRKDMGEKHLEPRSCAELYDLKADPLEKENLASKKEYSEIEKEMSLKLQVFLKQTDDPILKGKIPRPSGEEEIMVNIRSKDGMDGRYERENKIHERYDKLKPR